MKKRLMACEQQRQAKKKNAVYILSNSITRLRHRYRRDMKSSNEHTQYVACAVAIIDNTAERVGNNESASNGHYGISVLQCRHATISGNRIRLIYIGKSGVAQDKAFTDEDVAHIIRSRKRTCKNNQQMFPISASAVNRYLEPFGITAKDIRGYKSNVLMKKALSKYCGHLHGDKERKKAFLSEVKKVAGKVGHQPATLRKHYLLPNFETNYINYGTLPKVN